LGEATLKQTSQARQLAGFLWSHQLPIGLSLTLLALIDLCFIITNLDSDLGSFRGFYVLVLQWSLVIPVLFAVTLVGTLILCAYSMKGIQPQEGDHKEQVAILLAALGFTYQVIGAWPLWNQPYPWQWQQEIARYGNLLVFPLFAGSLLALIVGAASLYIHSKIWHQNHP
jgi:hypothetical protein